MKHTIISQFLYFIISFLTVFLITPTIRLGALRYLIIDKRNKRKIHKKVVTKLGGLAIYIAIFFAILVALLLDYNSLYSYIYIIGIFFIGATITLFLGIYDDIKGANALVKFSVQIVVAIIMIKAGLVVESFNFLQFNIVLGFLMWPVTILLFIGLINAINLIDGLDGLASGIIGIASIGYIIIFTFILKDSLLSLLSIVLLGACLGFLKYNSYPAKIFMGDTGSLFLGFTVAFLIIVTDSFGLLSDKSIMILLLPLAVPIIDTSFAFIRRIIKQKHPFTADNSHLHHILMQKGFSHSQTVRILHFITAIFTLLSIIFMYY